MTDLCEDLIDAPAQILSKDYENQTSPLHRPFLPASPAGMMFLQAEEVG